VAIFVLLHFFSLVVKGPDRELVVVPGSADSPPFRPDNGVGASISTPALFAIAAIFLKARRDG